MLRPVQTGLPQEQVNAYFQSSSEYWKRIYETRALTPLIYQTRQASVLDWISELRLPPSARILEIGCGAGVLTTELARAGFRIEAVDAAPAMLQLTQQNAIKNGVADRVALSLADVHALSFPKTTFDLVLAIGVIPWLHDEKRGLLEMRRVLKPNGHLVVTADNEWRLGRIVDPASTPIFRPFRTVAKSILRTSRLDNPSRRFQAKRHTPGEIDRLLVTSGLRRIKSKCVGFGPFTIFGRQIFTEELGISFHVRLQSLADQGIPPFHMTGSHYLTLAERV